MTKLQTIVSIYTPKTNPSKMNRPSSQGQPQDPLPTQKEIHSSRIDLLKNSKTNLFKTNKPLPKLKIKSRKCPREENTPIPNSFASRVY